MELSGNLTDVLIALLAGVASFLSPCVIPIVPGYLSFVTGFTRAELGHERRPVTAVVIPSLLFVLGFSVVFVAMGVTFAAIGGLARGILEGLRPLLGLFVVLMGLVVLGLIKVPWMQGEARIDPVRFKGFGRWAALLTGMAFAIGWTPCVGPILSAILAVSIAQGDVGRGALLLSAYSAGLGIPFVLTGALFGKLKSTLGWLNRHSLVLNRIAGVLLISLGLLIVFDRLAVLSGWLLRVLPSVKLL